MRKYLILLPFLFVFQSCIEMNNTFEKLPPGMWRGVLFLDPDIKDRTKDNIKTIQRVRDTELPFQFEIVYDGDDMDFIIHNGDERILLPDIEFTQISGSKRDSVRIDFPVYNSYILAEFKERYMSGYWYDMNRNDYRIPFKAIHGQDYRFQQQMVKKPIDFSGRWKVEFDYDKDGWPAIGEFEQKGSKITGTFMTETGDYRYLAGDVIGKEMYMSCFDGSHVFVFRAMQDESGNLIGVFRSGKHYECNWKAERNTNFILPSADSLTYLKEGYETLEFSFTTPEGKELNPSNSEFKGKAKIIQILGTWCPNCKDETEFLVDYLKEHPQEDLVIMALALEKAKGEKANQAIQTYRQKLNIPYEMAYAGSYRKSEAVKSLPALNAVISYPTLIFMDRENKIRHIYTGFSGPATSSFEAYTSKFQSYINEILEVK